MSDEHIIRAFNIEIDRMLGIETEMAEDKHEVDLSAEQGTLALASRLAGANLESEIKTQPALRAHWTRKSQMESPRIVSPAAVIRSRWTWVALAIIVLLGTLIIFRQPVTAAVGRLFGYGYFPEAGFIRLDSSRVLLNPVMQEHEGRSLTVFRGMVTRDQTRIWIEFSDTARPVDGARLETTSGQTIPLSGWVYNPDTPGSQEIQLTFPSLEEDVFVTVLAFPEGWRLPLAWVPASQSGLPDVHIEPFPAETQPSDPDASQPASALPASDVDELCADHHGMQVCVLAASTTPDSTSILLEAVTEIPSSVPGVASEGLIGQPESLELRGEDGTAYVLADTWPTMLHLQQSSDTAQQTTLPFQPVPGNQMVTLSIPAVLATVDIPDQLIHIELGEDPQPGQTISLQADIDVLGNPVRIRQGSLIGDGVNSLRLTLDAEPADTVDGITPMMLQMGKPEGIDDLYGSGNLTGSKDLFVELLRADGLINGTLELPVIQATVVIHGPFEFTFTLTELAPLASPTPQVADPDTFSPQPTSTPLALDIYQFSGHIPQPGDLLYTIIEEEVTQLYAANPASGFASERIATLPGQIYQVSLHPDSGGIDYLAGEQNNEGSVIYYRSISLYTLRFADPKPQRLHSFQRGSDNSVGTEVTAIWSSDGRLMVYQENALRSEPGGQFRRIGWIDMEECRQTGNCTPQILDMPEGLNLYYPLFAPNGYRLIASGYNSLYGSGATDIYRVDIQPDEGTASVTNLSDSDQIDEYMPYWHPITGQVIALCPLETDTSGAKKSFCTYDVDSGAREQGPIFESGNPRGFRISSNGKSIILLNLNNLGNGEHLNDFFLLDEIGPTGSHLFSSGYVNEYQLSGNGNYLIYRNELDWHLTVVSLPAGEAVFTLEAAQAGNPSWFGWVP